MALQLLEKDEKAMVGHALRIENAVEVVAFMLYDPGMKPGRLALENRAVEAVPAIADVEIARNDAAQPGNRQAPFPAERALDPDRLDDRVDQHRQILLGIAGQVSQPLATDPK